MNRHVVSAALASCAALLPLAAMAGPADRAADKADTRRELRGSSTSAAPMTAINPVLSGAAKSLRVGSFAAQLEAQAQLETAAPPPPPPPPAGPTLSFELDAPFSYSSNPEQLSSGADGDGHVDPSYDLTLEIPLKGMKLTLENTTDLDLNFHRPSNDSTTIEGVANLDLRDPARHAVTPYLNYTVDDIYEGRFGDHSITTHTFVGGLNYVKKLPQKPGDTAAPLKMALGAEVGRRLASTREGEQYRASVRAGLSGAFTDKVSWSLKGSALYKNYTGGTNDGRKDVALTGSAALSTEFDNGVVLEFKAQVQHNDSDRTGKDYTVWDIGPKLKKAF